MHDVSQKGTHYKKNPTYAKKLFCEIHLYLSEYICNHKSNRGFVEFSAQSPESINCWGKVYFRAMFNGHVETIPRTIQLFDWRQLFAVAHNMINIIQSSKVRNSFVFKLEIDDENYNLKGYFEDTCFETVYISSALPSHFSERKDVFPKGKKFFGWEKQQET